MKKLFALLLCLCALANVNGQYLRNNFLGTYPGRVEVYDVNYGVGTDLLFVNASASDSDNIVITDTIPWLNFEYRLNPDSTFTEIWNPTQRYGHFYSNGDSIFIHDVHNSPYFREWHCGRLGAGVNEISESPFSIYPNPARNKIYISTDKQFDNLQIRLFNSLGQSVLENKVSSSQRKVEIELLDLDDGIYFIKIESEKNSYSQMVIIQK